MLHAYFLPGNLGPADLQCVRREIFSINHKWYDIGLELKVVFTTLDNIKANFSETCKCLTEMLKHWLTRTHPHPSWSGLVKALSSEPVGEKRLAREIHDKYCEVFSDERAQKIINRALEKGCIKQRNIVGVLTGLMGSGKTWLLNRLFHMPPPDVYTSTGASEKSLRGLLCHIGNIESWKLLSKEDLENLLVPFFSDGMTQTDRTDIVALLKILSALDPSDAVTSASLSQFTIPSPENTQPSDTFSARTEALPLPGKSPLGKGMVSKIKRRMAYSDSASQPLMPELVFMIDTGGQPELMEVMPSFIHNANLALLVLNLMYSLDEHPPISLHIEGVDYKRKLSSQYTVRQIVLKLASTLQSKMSRQLTSTNLRLLVVATHPDCVEGDVMSRIDMLNKELKSLLLPLFKEELILFETPDKIAFVVNLKKPNRADEKTLELIRTKVSEQVGQIFDVPNSFFILEQNLIEFATTKNRHILLLDECVQVGKGLKMDDEMVKAALVLFHRQNTFLYFRHILPNHIFVNPQIPLDVVNRIVRFNYQVNAGELQGFPAKFISSLQDGIITEEMFNLKELSSLFVPGIYECHHAIKLLCHTFTIAPLSCEQQQSNAISQSSSCKEFLMMCLLPTLSDKQLAQHIPHLSDTVPLVIKFNNNFVPLNCFSSTISCLLSEHQWIISSKGDSTSPPECLAHNIASLYDENHMKIVLVDVAHHIEVYVEEDDRDILQKVCSQVCETVFSAIKRVFDVMRLSKLEVTRAVLCPCKAVPKPHSACYFPKYGKNYLYCSATNKSVGTANDQHMMWLCNDVTQPAVNNASTELLSHPPFVSTVTTSEVMPNLLELQQFKIHQKVLSYRKFGTFLLKDDTGSIVNNIKAACLGKPEDIVTEILIQWINGRGQPCTWMSLIEALRHCDLNVLANEIVTRGT